MARTVYPMWWLVVAISFAIVRPGGGPRQIVATLLVFRSPRTLGPLPGVTIGWVLFVGLCAALLIPLWSRIITTGPPPDIEARARREFSGVAALIVVGALWRVLCLISDQTATFGPLSHLPGQLDLIAIGMGVAVFEAARVAGHRTLGREPTAIQRWVLPTFVVTTLVYLTTMAGDRAVRDEFNDVVIRHLEQASMVAAILIAMVWLPKRADRRWLGWASVAAPGLLLLHEPIVDLVVRQYRERVSDVGGVRFLTGPATPPFVWAAVIAVAAGTVMTAAATLAPRTTTRFSGRLDRQDGATGPRYGLRLAGIVGGAFLWRLIALLSIAPERTDGGDPFFYHTTANLLAEGRGSRNPSTGLPTAR